MGVVVRRTDPDVSGIEGWEQKEPKALTSNVVHGCTRPVSSEDKRLPAREDEVMILAFPTRSSPDRRRWTPEPRPSEARLKDAKLSSARSTTSPVLLFAAEDTSTEALCGTTVWQLQGDRGHCRTTRN